jgi:hypothetical protein
MPSAELQKRRAALAALLEAREAPQLPAGTVQTGEFGLSNEPLRFYFSIYVTDKNLEPVSGLRQESFSVQHLLIPGGTFVQFSPEITFWESDLPGVYRLNQTHPTCQAGDIFGVTVRRRKPKPGRAGAGLVAAEFDTGFCMVTVAGAATNAVST